MARTYSDIQADGFIDGWDVGRLWELTRQMPRKRVPLEEITDFDLVTWFNPNCSPTSRAVAEHAKRIQEVIFDYPIILSAKGEVMDGMHRVAKAWVLGMKNIEAVQFDKDPEPDERIMPENLPGLPWKGPA